MKKVLAIFALCAAVLSCEKENQGNNSGNGGQNGSEASEINDISFPGGNEFMINELDVDGKVMPVGLKPDNAPSSLLRITVEDPSIATAQPVKGGILFKPLKVGVTEVSVGATAGAATTKKLTLTVSKSEEYSDYTINSIIIKESSLSLDDYEVKTAELSVTLDAAGATLSDVHVSSSNEYIVKVAKVAPTTLRFTMVQPGDATVSITALRGKGKATLPVKVYGHIREVYIGVPDSVNESGGYSGIMIGSNPTLVCNVDKTGDLKDTPGKAEWVTYYSAGGKQLFTVERYGGTLTTKTAAGSSDYQVVSVHYGGFGASAKIRVYSFGNKVVTKNPSTGDELPSTLSGVKINGVYTLKVVIEPSTARQDYEVTVSDEAALETSSPSGSNILTLKGVSARYEDVRVTISPKYKNGKVEKEHRITVDQYGESDLKPGDYVYYNSSTKKFNHSDGGLRYFEESSGKCRCLRPGQVSGKGNYIGLIFNIFSGDATDLLIYEDTDLKKIKLCGLSDVSSGKKNCYVVSSSSAGSGKWGEQTFIVTGLSTENKLLDYTNKLVLDTWNKNNASSGKRVMAHKYAVDYSTTTGVLIGTSSSAGSTGWMLPCKKTADIISKAAYLQKAEGWTSTEYSTDKAYYFKLGKSVEPQLKMYVGSGNQVNGDVYPILIL